MTHFDYRDGELFAEDVPLSRIAEAVGTPVYVYSETALTDAYRRFAGALAEAGLDARVCYAMKANSNLAVVRALAACGAGADVVSGGELARALAAGVNPAEIVFSGVGKTGDEMRQAIAASIGQFNIESIPELERLSEVANATGATVNVAVRVNPDVDADTHHKISTGRHHDKFGIDIDRAREVYDRAAALPGIAPVAVAVHIGSQLTDLSPFRAAFTRVAALVHELRADGHDITTLDLGGGLGIDYGQQSPPDPRDYAAIVADTVGDLGCTLVFEPGRYLAGPAGVLLTEIIYVKDGETRSFAIVDAAMNDLVRPAMYDAHHEVLAVRQPNPDRAPHSYDIVGPVCETGDTFATQRDLPVLEAGELVVIRDAGAYGAVMASGYNSRLLIAEVLVRGSGFSVVRARQDIAAMLAQETLADWQT
ncbi:MAG: diaminopimelate decarboxylase [Rhodospirillaceae bacterium]|jgi:diaminopimelate decarboxylase|nr:diaminopimelate decarboxylase [Rhodospirillaceae bacterium]MBT5943017.1 diaminopimelate decarboxylase [Rhodospirillaceae bacterium]MBT6403860.1 diaminopimelate decarboxylase [Rhodospirillaceae bacterium]MBT6537636.1 diaminopimelate decarboxylase [Rhodospirillaceae bacterium]MBT7362957.1 diaminopimelate decarboxylase [Rhodospirillaceae bacterium]